MTPEDELKSAWNAQPLPRQITMNADVLLQHLRGNKARFTSELLRGTVIMILGWVVMAFGFMGFSIYKVRHGAPWYAFSGSFLLGIILLAIAAYTALDRFRQMRRVSLSAPVLACAEEESRPGATRNPTLEQRALVVSASSRPGNRSSGLGRHLHGRGSARASASACTRHTGLPGHSHLGRFVVLPLARAAYLLRAAATRVGSPGPRTEIPVNFAAETDATRPAGRTSGGGDGQ